MLHRCLGAGVSLVLVLAFAAAAATAAAAEDFPPISAEERALAAVPGEPNAPAVVIFRGGAFRMMGTRGSEASSLLAVRVRIKVLTEAGKEHGDVKIGHSSWVRLGGFEGRTILPDGTVVPLPKEAAFKRTASRSRRLYVTSVAFPSVQVGAILDYKYELRWDSPLMLEPWVFQDRLPVLHSEIVYEVPSVLRAIGWSSDPMQVGIKSETAKTATGTRIRVWADRLPAVPDEVDSLPLGDMAARQILLPAGFSLGVHLFDTWPSACEFFYMSYETARHRSAAAERRARALAAQAAAPPTAPRPAAAPAVLKTGSGAAGTAGTAGAVGASNGPATAATPQPSLQRRQALAIFEFVRDEIATVEGGHVGLSEYSNVDSVLDSRRGLPAEKALLLQAMLAAVGIESRLVWAADREGGSIDLRLPNPAWFDRVLVAADVDGRRVFLDPCDRALAFGHLDPGYEGTAAVLYDHKKPENIVLPESPFSDNLRQAKLDLELDAGGRAAGRGTLTLLGHPAFRRTRWQGDAASTTEAWSKWLRERFPGFDVAEVTASESLDPPRVEVSWSLSQHPEEALGDQATIVASRPLGPVRQRFPQGLKRRTAVVLDFPEREEVELTLHWAAGWQPDVVPRAVNYQIAAGAVVSKVEVDAAKNQLVYRRRFDLVHRKATTAEQFAQVQVLFEEAQKSDAQALVLAHH
jgi:hypothetical protein